MYLKLPVAMFSLVVASFFSTNLSAEETLLDIDDVISVEDLRADFDTWMDGYNKLHPDPDYSADPQEVADTAAFVKSQLTHPLSQLEAWRLFSLMNPTFRDAHSGISLPNSFATIDARLESGERLFPFEVLIDGNNRVFLREAYTGRRNLDAGTEIISINRRLARDVVAEMLRHRTGDTARFQRKLISYWFSHQYWALFGSAPTLEIEYLSDGKIKRARFSGADRLSLASRGDLPFESRFSFKFLSDGSGYIQVDSFETRYKDDFLAMTQKAFTSFRDNKVENVIIDIRNNRGGNNNLWQKGIMPYIADKPFKHVSTYKARVTEENADPGDVVGEVVSGDYDNLTDPDLDNPLRFEGNTYLMVGELTYSSAIHFAITVQDFQIGSIAGTPTGGRAGTTGNTNSIALPNSGLSAYAPTILFSRPHGENNRLSVQPDIFLLENPFDPDTALQELIESFTG